LKDSPEPPLIEVEDLGLRVENRWLVRKLNFAIAAGEFFALVGNSGSGKSTLLKTLAGIRKPEEGSVRVNAPTTLPIGMIFQDLQLADGASALKNALSGSLGRHSFLSTLFGFPKDELEEANKLMHTLGLSGKSKQWTSILSRGERQRLAIVRSLIAHPSILLADEPVASLDQDWAEQTLQLIKDRQGHQNGCVVCSLHDLDQVEDHANQVLQLNEEEPEKWSLIAKERNTP